MSTLPTPLTDAIHHASDDWRNDQKAARAFADLAAQLERDAMTLALWMYDESPDTLPDDTRECMDRWRPRVKALLEGETP